jgi:hypothetical protein
LSGLTAERLRETLHYDPETGAFTHRHSRTRGRRPVVAGDVAGCLLNTGYRSIRVDGKAYLAHRLAWLYVYGEWPNLQIDHINGNRSDNKLKNLRQVSNAINSQNIRVAREGKKYASPLGACYQPRYKRKWLAKIRVDGSLVIVGRYETAEEAHAAYVKAKRQLHEGCTI